ncbi:nickel insertion protein [Tumidithrix elongata RA019]|uniref:Nickel insertion protein n=1 Tax=Tumidithrix elongata BACA0141 TaxID=2716417 RepID=A0AAW9PUS2_9CYAN|nr:nickel insertion protein [Tumidithrix elongata RA019]
MLKIVSQPYAVQSPQQLEVVAVLETQVDDLSPQVVAYVMEQLLHHGALDVFTQAVGMKKSRTGLLLTAICPSDRAQICEQVLFRETTTLGIRHRLQERTILPREIRWVDTEYGRARVKITQRSDIYTVHPEYEDCAQLARQHQVPLLQIQRAVQSAGEGLIAI